MIRKTADGFWIIDGDTHLGKWVEEGHTLICDNGVALILPLLKPGMTVVDVGAFIGDHTTAYLKAVGGAGRVFAFEPQDEAYACLVANCPEAISFHLGVSNRTTTGTFVGRPNSGAGFVSMEPGPVVLVKLDDFHFGRKVDLIKIDAEGYEPLIIEGAMDTIKRDRPAIVCEFNVKTLARLGLAMEPTVGLLAGLGYSCRDLYGTTPSWEQEQWDAIFTYHGNASSGKP